MRADALGAISHLEEMAAMVRHPARHARRTRTISRRSSASAARFGGKVVEDKVYDLPPGARNLDSGHQQMQAQIPMETQGAPEHDVVWVINSDDDFGDYLLYRTYMPRPVVGTQGLQAIAWDKSYTESGAMHFQNAIPRIAKRRRSSATTPPGLASARSPIRR